MEVNSGTSEVKRHLRRHSDRSNEGGNRNLHWKAHFSDVLLLPQSPLSIQSLLNQPGSRIRLAPVDTAQPQSSQQAEQPAKQVDHTGHLKTQYTAKILREKCRQVVIESALVKSKNEKCLYITAGFLNWTAAQNDSPRLSPLLFYPVRLITEDRETGDGVDHLLLNEEGVPEYNYHLFEEFRRITSVELPQFNPRQSLSHFMSQVEHAISGAKETSILYAMQLGIVAAPAGINSQHTTRLPKLDKFPDQFRFSLAKRLIKNQALDDLQTTLKLLDASNDFTFSQTHTDSTAEAPDIASVREFSILLAQYGLGHIDFQLLPDLPDRINSWIADIEPAFASELLQTTLGEHELTPIQLMKLSGIVELIDKAPDNMGAVLHKDLAYRGSQILFKRARHQAKLIHEELAQLQHHFHLDRIPAKSQLLQLIEELGGSHEQDIDVVDSDYFNARRQFMDFSTDKPTTLSTDHKRLLGKLVKVLRFRELFVNNTEYRLALGPAYRGLKTDWEKLEAVLDYAQELRQVLGSTDIAASAIKHWEDFRAAYTTSLPQLLVANTAIRALLKIIRSIDPASSAPELLVKAKILSDQVRSWNIDSGLIKNYGNKNANSVLHLFSGKAKIDARTEVLVRDANNHIQDFLLDNQETVALHQIDQTIAWLNGAVNTESISMDDILREMELAEDN